MNSLRQFPFRILIVDDEERDWAKPMQLLLKRALTDSGLEKVQVDVAMDNEGAHHLLATHYYHFSSFDMRLPERQGETISVDYGLALARAFPWYGFPKRVVYSQTIRDEEIKENPRDAASVLRLPADLYAKPTNADADAQAAAVEVLSVRDWAQRVAESLSSDVLTLKLPHRAKTLPMIQTVVGAYLTHGVDLLPPFLAKKLHELANVWETRSGERVEAAIAFIEGVMRLALVQSAVLLSQDGKPAELPSDEKLVTCIATLRRWQTQLLDWNWCHYLTVAAIDAFDQARGVRNDRYHSMVATDHQKNWVELRAPLQYAMDIAAYWVRHPLLVNLRYSRDGWSGELLAGRVMPGKRLPLPEALDFPTEAIQDGIWQSVWRLDEQKLPQSQPLPWDGWMVQAVESDHNWWFPRCCRQGRPMTLSLIDGKQRT